MSFHPRWDPGIEAEGPIRMSWEVEPTDDGGSKLTVTSALTPGSKSAEEFAGGIVYIVSGLKTFIETGEPLVRGLTPARDGGELPASGSPPPPATQIRRGRIARSYMRGDSR